jgi:DNA repair exonuclease SbcCD ATPase subunit
MQKEQDRLQEEQDRLQEEQDRLQEEQDRLQEEQDRLQEEQDRLQKEQDRLQDKKDKLLTETLLIVPFSLIGRCSPVSTPHWLQGKCARFYVSQGGFRYDFRDFKEVH